MPRRGERKYTTMMLYPAMNTLTKNVPNRYLLVNVVARRARQIAEDAELEGIHLTEKPVTEAINEVATARSPRRTLIRTSISKNERFAGEGEKHGTADRKDRPLRRTLQCGQAVFLPRPARAG